MICWSCHERVTGPVCVGCGVIQPPAPTVDPFVTFGLAPRYHLDLTDVDSRYRALARKVHPDRFAGKPAVERRMALQWTAAINEARRILRDDTTRARWLATGQALPGETGPKLDPEFLQEMFEWREADEDRPGALREAASTRAQALREEIDHLFTAWEEGRGDLSLVEDRLARLKYVTGLVREEERGEHRN